jgi:hypothetical protein
MHSAILVSWEGSEAGSIETNLEDLQHVPTLSQEMPRFTQISTTSETN